MKESLSIKILRAAVSLMEESETFTANELVVRAWEMYPCDFGLDPYPHPDCNRVLSACMGQRGLVGLGYLRLVSPKVYAVTASGSSRVQADGRPSQVEDAAELQLARTHTRFLLHMENSVAVAKRHRRERVFLVDALDFWRLDGAATAEQIRERIADIKESFRAIESNSPESSPEAKRARVMRHVHEDLLVTFERSLGLCEARMNNRKRRDYHYA
jgi:hypothetical protein